MDEIKPTFVSIEEVLQRTNKTAEEFNKLYEQGFFQRAVTSPKLITASSIDDYFDGKTIRYQGSIKQKEFEVASAKKQEEEGQRREARILLHSNIVRAFKLKRQIAELPH